MQESERDESSGGGQEYLAGINLNLNPLHLTRLPPSDYFGMNAVGILIEARPQLLLGKRRL